MGTRADFYVGRGKQSEWLGSIGMDGYPDGIDAVVLNASDEAEYRQAVSRFITRERSGTAPEQGWPWPWVTSSTTDYAYAFDEGRVWASSFGTSWFIANEDEPEESDGVKSAEFPDMSQKQKVTMGARSGLLGVFGVTPSGRVGPLNMD